MTISCFQGSLSRLHDSNPIFYLRNVLFNESSLTFTVREVLEPLLGEDSSLFNPRKWFPITIHEGKDRILRLFIHIKEASASLCRLGIPRDLAKKAIKTDSIGMLLVEHKANKLKEHIKTSDVENLAQLINILQKKKALLDASERIVVHSETFPISIVFYSKNETLVYCEDFVYRLEDDVVDQSRSEKIQRALKSIQWVSSIAIQSLRIIFCQIEKYHTSWTSKAKALHYNLYLRQGISRSLLIDCEGKIYINFNKKRLGDKALGAGVLKTVTTALCVESGTIYASAGMRRSKACNEVANLTMFRGKKGFAQLHRVVEYEGKRSVKTRLLLEYCNKGNLRNFLKKEELDIRVKFKISLDVLQALKTIHEMGSVHRDLKLSNILIHQENADSELTAQLCDLSSICRHDDIHKLREHCTTSWYVSPEYAHAWLHKSAEEIAKASTTHLDIWSFGCVLYQIFIGKLPWGVTTDEAISIREIASLDRTWFAEPVRNSIEHLIWEILQIAPSARPSLHDIEEALSQR